MHIRHLLNWQSDFPSEHNLIAHQAVVNSTSALQSRLRCRVSKILDVDITAFNYPELLSLSLTIKDGRNKSPFLFAKGRRPI